MNNLKQIKKWKIDFFVLLFFSLLFFIFRYNPINGDSLLAWPITEQFAKNIFEGVDDLIIQAGVKGVFFTYILLAKFPFLSDNYPLRDFLLYVPLFIIYVFLWYLIFIEISKNRYISLLSIAFFIFSDNKLGLNWSQSPMTIFVSISSIHWLQILAFWLFLKHRHALSFTLLGLSAYLHPGSGLSYFLVMASVIVYLSYKEKDFKLLFRLLFFLVITLPLFVLLLKKINMSIFISEYMEIFKIFQYHAYLEDHFKEGYSYTIALIFILYNYWTKKRNDYLNIIISFFIFSLLWSIAWLLNLYFIKSLSFIQTYFITRIFYLLKPLLILFFVSMLNNFLIKKQNLSDSIFVFLMLSTLIVFSPIFSLIIIVSFFVSKKSKFFGYMALVTLSLTFYLIIGANSIDSLLINFLKKPSYNNFLFFEIVLLFLTLVLLSKKNLHKNIDNLNEKNTRFICVGILCFTFWFFLLNINKIYNIKHQGLFKLSWKNYFGVENTNSYYIDLIKWAKSKKKKLFIVPPDEYIFLTFRYFAKNGLYITEYDINQLMYSPDFYIEGLNRLKLLGVEIRGKHKTFYDKYYYLSYEDVKSTQADYIVFDKTKLRFTWDEKMKVFENKKYVVYKLR